jgi:hypothetical protein
MLLKRQWQQQQYHRNNNNAVGTIKCLRHVTASYPLQIAQDPPKMVVGSNMLILILYYKK